MCLRLVPIPLLACVPGKYHPHLAAQLLFCGEIQKTNMETARGGLGSTLGAHSWPPGGRRHSKCHQVQHFWIPWTSLSGFPDTVERTQNCSRLNWTGIGLCELFHRENSFLAAWSQRRGLCKTSGSPRKTVTLLDQMPKTGPTLG